MWIPRALGRSGQESSGVEKKNGLKTYWPCPGESKSGVFPSPTPEGDDDNLFYCYNNIWAIIYLIYYIDVDHGGINEIIVMNIYIKIITPPCSQRLWYNYIFNKCCLICKYLTEMYPSFNFI